MYIARNQFLIYFHYLSMISVQNNYQEKFRQIVGQTSFGLLPAEEQRFITAKATQYRFTQQELRQISAMALDRIRWKETALSSIWPSGEDMGVNTDNRSAKKKILKLLRESQQDLRVNLKDYSRLRLEDKPKTRKPVLKATVQPQLGLGRCPVASERTRCCNLMTLDAVEKCGFDCSYCSIQSFYHGDEVVFDSSFAEKLGRLKLDPDKTYHIGTGQSSDSLMWGNHQGILAALCEFARKNPNVILELKTKSKNIGWLLKNDVPANVICTWSLNPQTIIDHEEHLSASLAQRIDSAKALTDKGCVVGFHFHPIIHYHGWECDYAGIGETLVKEFDSAQIALVSMGTLTFTKSVMKTIRNRDLTSKILQMPMEPSAGKLSYPLEVKLDIFRHVYGSLNPWHEKVFFYLCMEPQSLWKPVFGFDYDDNATFEKAMKSAYFDKINGAADNSPG
jgi:spore photoproduct lyase